MHSGDTCLLFVIGAVVFGIYLAFKVSEHRADRELQRTNPELWAKRQMVQLERERLEAQKKLAEEEAKRENLRRNAGFIAGMGRGMGWW